MEPHVSRIGFFITIGTALFLAIVPNVADWSASHIFHPDWTAHARFHTVWQLIMQTMLAALAIGLCLRGRLVPAAVLNLVVLAGFFVALALTGLGLFEGGLNDLADGTNQVGALDANLVSFTVLGFVQLFGLWRAQSS